MEGKEIIETSFNIIFLAGEARAASENALKDIERFDYKSAEKHIEEAHKKITEAHTVHTQVIQSNMESMEAQDYYMIFTHAQDTLMTINSEIILAKHLLRMFKALDEKLSKVQ